MDNVSDNLYCYYNQEMCSKCQSTCRDTDETHGCNGCLGSFKISIDSGYWKRAHETT